MTRIWRALAVLTLLPAALAPAYTLFDFGAALSSDNPEPQSSSDECVVYSVEGGEAKTDCDLGDEGNTGGGGGGNETSGGGGGILECMYRSEFVPCETGDGTWSNSRGCWLRLAAGFELDYAPPMPPDADPATGAWFICTEPVSASGGRYEWVENTEVDEVDPRVLVNRILASWQLQPLDLAMFPPVNSSAEAAAVVGIPVWFWTNSQTPNNWGPLAETASQGSTSVTVEANVERAVFDFGNGDTITCNTFVPYSASFQGQESPACSYTFLDWNGEGTTMRVTSEWSIRWSASTGAAGSLTATTYREVVIPVREVQTVLVPND